MPKILFVNKVFGFEQPCLSLEFLSSYLKSKGHQVELILDFNDANFKNRLARRIRQYSPDLIGFSVLTPIFTWAIATSRFIKTLFDIPIVFGNIHPTALPEHTLNQGCVDFVVRGEGEYALLNLLECIEKDTDYRPIPNLCYLDKRDAKNIICNPMSSLIDDIDSLPFPDKSITLKEACFYDDIYYTMTERGCVKNCTFCFNHFLRNLYSGKGMWRRRRSAGNVIDELMIAKKQKYRLIHFNDDSFISNPEWLDEFAGLYKKHINMPFQINACPEHITEETAGILSKIGCLKVKIGIQTISDRLKRDICRRFENVEKIPSALDYLKKNGIYAAVDTMYNLPTQTESEIIEDLKFYNAIRPNEIIPFNLIYFPQTDIVDIALQHGLINGEDIDKIRNEGLMADYIKDTKLLRFVPLVVDLPAAISSLILKYKLWRKIPFVFYNFYSKYLWGLLRMRFFNRRLLYFLQIRRFFRYKLLIIRITKLGKLS